MSAAIVSFQCTRWGRTPVLRPASMLACCEAGPGGPAQTWRSAPLAAARPLLRHGLVRALAEAAFQPGGQRYGGVAILVAQPVGGGRSLLPAFVLAFVQQVQLLVDLFKRRCVHAQQAHVRAGLP